MVDTNVLVSGLLTRAGTCAQVLEAIRAGRLTPLFDERMLAEYREILARPTLRLPADVCHEMLVALQDVGERVEPFPYGVKLADPDDRPFLEVAISGNADALVTGNRRHFPTSAVAVLSPAQVLALLE